MNSGNQGNGQGNRRLSKRYDGEGIASTTVQLTPSDDMQRVEVEVKDEAVPIVFVPGIMGSNLRNKETGEAVWTPNSIFRLAWQWVFRGAATRQRKLNPETTEVDDGGAFFGSSATVPDAETAKERGWGTVAKYGYGKFIPWLDDTLNKDEAASPWEGMVDNEGVVRQWTPEKDVETLTRQDSDKGSSVFCPVHCVGYNWLQSNGESGKYLVEKIDEIMAYWRDGGGGARTRYRCEKVILVTHSMGGLVSRAAVHDAYGMEADEKIREKVLGIVHGVMPALGAPAAYHHVRTGYDFPTGLVLGGNAGQITAVFANAAGPLELLPTQLYRKGWLTANDPGGEVMVLQADDPYEEIYAEPEKWWRLVDRRLIDPAKLHGKSQPPVDPWIGSYIPNLDTASEFHVENIKNWYFDPCYVHYGADPDIKTYQTIAWASKRQVVLGQAQLQAAGIHGKKSDPVTLDAPGRPKFKIPKATEPGDETVSEWSGAGPGESGGEAVKQSFRLTGIEHGSSYDKSDAVQQSTLYSIGKLLGDHS